MINRKTLIFTALLAFYVMYVNPLIQESAGTVSSANIKKRTLVREKAVYEHREEAKEKAKELIEINRQNEQMFYSAESTASMDFTGMQTLMRKFAQDNGCSYKNAMWAEPIPQDWYSVLSMQVIVECPPQGFPSFINSITGYEKLLTIDTMMAAKPRKEDHLVFRGFVSGYKLRSE
ncbi:hypothetical protein [Limisalsivibrio acetivorans]|uniref:hypothetical protein n=1 Tax=Limisalsivibrio acetivorans TaxID=1304888 RepID=UPI0003B52AD3|nr:hypothetical protein [Limisalsivibrio acetivorans]